MNTSRCRRRLLGFGLLLLGIILLGPLQAGSTNPPPTFGGTTFYGGAGDQFGTAVTINNSAVYVGGTDAGSPSSAVSYLLRYDLSTYGTGVLPDGQQWVGNGTGLFGLAVTDTALYTAGWNYNFSTDLVNPKEAKSLLANFNLDGTPGGSYDGSNWFAMPNFFVNSGFEMFNGVATVGSGESTYIYATGAGQVTNNHSAFDVAKFDSSGNLLAAATDSTLGIAFNSSYLPSLNSSLGSAVTTAGGFVYVAGSSSFEDGTNRPVLWTFDGDLNYVNRTLTSTTEGYLFGLTAYDGALYAVGTATVGGNSDCLLQKYDTSGNLQWTTTWGGAGYDELNGLVGLGGKLYAVGSTDSEGSGGRDAVLYVIDPASGTVLSSQVWGGGQDDIANGVAAYGTNLYVVGQSKSNATGGNVLGQSDIMLTQFDTTGATPIGYKYDFMHFTTNPDATPIQLNNTSVGVPVNAPAVGYNPIRITNNSFTDSSVQTNASGQMVWQENGEIFYYDSRNPGNTPRQITTSIWADTNPQINDQGQIVWEGAGDIFYYDTRAWNETPHQLTNNPFTDSNPQINANGQIVWTAPIFTGGPEEIYYYDTRVAGETAHQLTTDSLSDWTPQINANGQIVWYGGNETTGTEEIYYYDTRVGDHITHQITTNNFNDDLPQINANGQIVWTGASGPGGAWEVYYYDTRVGDHITHQISDNSFGNDGPQINANGQIVWFGGGGSGGTTEIYYYDTRVAGETAHRITNNSFYDYDPQINANGQIVWYGNGGTGGWNEIYYYDKRVSGETVHQVTFDSFNNYDPKLTSQGQITWYGYGGSGGTAEIYLAYSAGSVQPTPQTNDMGQTVWSAWDGDNYNIYLYDNGQVRQLTYGGYGEDNLYPWINNNGQIAYVMWDSGALQVHEYDLITGVDREINFSNHNQYDPMIDDQGRIVWLETPGFTGDNHTHYKPTELSEVWMYDPNYPGFIHRIADNNWTSFTTFNRPVINIAGQVVYTGWDIATHINDIYRYNSADGTTTKLTTGGGINPWIDDMGDVVYSHYDGTDSEIYRLWWNSSVPEQITNNNVNDMNPVIVNGDLIAWQEFTANNSTDIYLFSAGLTNAITNNSFYDSAPMVNHGGQITWMGNWVNNSGVITSGPPQVYRLDTRGDFYSGTVVYPTTMLTPNDHGYYPGFPYHPLGTNGLPRGDVYYITGYHPTPITDPSQFGEVYVDNYWDAQSRQTFDLTGDVPPAGINYLGSEQGDILGTGNPQQAYSGVTGQQADVPLVGYEFTYHYANGDYYTGWFYDPPGTYYEGWRRSMADETGTGFYHIDRTAGYSQDINFLGQVYVDSYYDTDTQATYKPLHAGSPVGTKYLGSESDWIIGLDPPQFYFGKGYYEANVTFDNQTFLYRQIGTSDYEASYPRLNSLGQVVWVASDGHDKEIYLWDNGVVTQLTNNDYDDDVPAIMGNRQVAWSGQANGYWQVFYYDGATVHQLTYNTFDNAYSLYTVHTNVDYSYYQGVWSNGQYLAWGGGPAGDKEIYRYNIATGILSQITTNAYNDDFPMINGSGVILWQGWDGTNYDIYRYNPVGGQITNISNNDGWNRTQRINDRGQIVWTSNSGGDYEIYLYDPVTGLTNQLTNNNYDDLRPNLNASGQVTWSGQVNGVWQIFTWNDGQTFYVTDSSYDNTNPAIMPNGTVYWNGFDGAHWQVYEFAGGQIYQVTHSDFDVRQYSQYSDGRVVWVESNGQGSQIYRAGPQPSLYTVTELSQGGAGHDPFANNSGEVAWYGSGGTTNQIYLYQDGAVHQITTGTDDNNSPTINTRGQMTWAAQVGNYWQVFFYDGQTVQQLTYDPFDNGHSAYNVNYGSTVVTMYHQPMITESGEVIWSGGPTDNKDIYVWDGSAIRNLTNPNGTDTVNDDYEMVNIYGDIVWQHGPSGAREVYYYDHTSGNITPVPHPVLDNFTDVKNVRINQNGTIAFAGLNGTQWDIYVKRAYETVPTDISLANTYDDIWPRINASDEVVWQGWDGHDWEIYKYDGFNTYQKTDNNADDILPRINDPGQVVWQGWTGFDWNIFLYDGGITSQISGNMYDDVNPKINNLGQIYWAGNDAAGVTHIYMATPTTLVNRTVQITNTPGVDDQNVSMNASGQIVWSGWDGHDTEIYTSTYDPVTGLFSAPTALTNNSLYDNAPRINNLGDIVYDRYDPNTYNSAVYLRSHLTGVETPIAASGFNPVINDAGWIVYESYSPMIDGTVIYLYNPTTGTSTFIANGDDASINNRRQIAYESWDGHDNEIWMSTVHSLLSNQTVTVDDINKKFSRAAGSWITDGVQVGDRIITAGFGNGGNNGTFIVTAVSALEITCAGASNLVEASGNTGVNLTATRSIRITNNNYEDDKPWINDHGQVTWTQDGGTGSQVYQWSAGLITPVSGYGADAAMGTANNFGDKQYIATDGHDLEVYLKFADGQVMRLTNDGVDEYQGIINNLDLVAYSETTATNNQDIFAFAPGGTDAARYNFTFYYANGDFYTGTVIAPLTQLYAEGYKQYVTDENGREGYYQITAVENLYQADITQYGQVRVDTYYDYKSCQVYTPLAAGTPAGLNYLGSESNYIVDTSTIAHLFGSQGGTFYEADLSGPPLSVNRYDFVYTYYPDDAGASDYYYGSVYATPADVPTLLAATSPDGYYQFVNMASGFDAALNGRVQVSAYGDTNTRHLYAVPNTIGTFGAETAQFWGAGGEVFTFGPTSAVDPLNRYSFIYYYNDGSGDYYSGDVYASVTEVPALLAASGPQGHYQFVDMAYGFDPLQHIPVEVSAYYDAETRHVYPLQRSYTSGAFLGDEYAPVYGQEYVNFDPYDSAHLVNRYTFVYTYSDGSGDKYYGNVYTTADQVPTLLGVHSSYGNYQFVDMAYGFDPLQHNPVEVTTYIDADTRHAYDVYPWNTLNTLGVELSAFNTDSGNAFVFGPGSHSNVVNRYSFVYTYNTGGDYYYGNVYATAAEVPSLLAVTSPGGHYQFVNMAYGFDAALDDTVQVTAYVDANSGHLYAVFNPSGPFGSETARFVGGGDHVFTFGPNSAADAVNCYSFVYTYNTGGDYYYGNVYATAAEVPSLLAAGSLDGHYQFVDMDYGFAPPANPVRVTAYFDSSSRHLYAAGNSVGVLGSETARFEGRGGDLFTFGPTSAADALNRYSFVYTYINSGGDYYDGYVYASAAQVPTLLAAYSPYGYYQFVDMAYGFAPPANPVQVTDYFDAASGHTYAASNTTGALGFEIAAFSGAAGSPFSFGPTQAVDAVNRYSFVYTYYTGGDYYYGEVYATEAQSAALPAVTNAMGHYQFVDMAYGFYTGLGGKVYVNAYYDGQSNALYTPGDPDHLLSVPDVSGLGNEYGNIIDASLSIHYFGLGSDHIFHEADAAN